MIKRLALPIRVEQIRDASQIALEVSFERNALREWTLGIVLVQERLVEALSVSQLAGSSVIEIHRSGETSRRAHVTFAGATARVVLSDNELEHLVHFFLGYFRDGEAPVDHIDVQAVADDPPPAECYITFLVPESVPPVSAAEARKRLGLSE